MMEDQTRQRLLAELPSHRGLLIAVCRRQLRWHPDAYELGKDLAQDVMIKAFTKIDTFREGSKLSSWLTRIAINRSISFCRPKFVRAIKVQPEDLTVATNEFGPKSYTFNPFVTNHTEEIYINRIAIKRLFQGLDKESKVLVLMLMEGRSYDEMSVLLRLPLSTVKSRIYHMRAKLNANLVGKQRYH
ncbi:MAG: RNA polymerase sigma factor [Candidatus Doudnabacteria bacterium]|nr:RNA polymerase sigma factor [Candidatus Doudnabacteria bacterium]